MHRRTTWLTDGQIIEPLSGALVVVRAAIEMGAVQLLFEQRDERLECIFDVTDEAKIYASAPPDLFAAIIDLNHSRIGGKEIWIREVRSKHEQNIAVHHGVIAGRESQQAGHADVIRIVVLNELFAS
jgi:hypothetical protein